MAPTRTGLLAFHIGLRLLCGVSGIGWLGPLERDTRRMTRSIGVNELWVGVAVLSQGILDAYR